MVRFSRSECKWMARPTHAQQCDATCAMDADETLVLQSFPHLHKYTIELCARSVPHLLFSLPPPWKSIRTRLENMRQHIKRVNEDMEIENRRGLGLSQLTAYGTSDWYLLVSDEVKRGVKKCKNVRMVLSLLLFGRGGLARAGASVRTHGRGGALSSRAASPLRSGRSGHSGSGGSGRRGGHSGRGGHNRRCGHNRVFLGRHL